MYWWWALFSDNKNDKYGEGIIFVSTQFILQNNNLNC